MRAFTFCIAAVAAALLFVGCVDEPEPRAVPEAKEESSPWSFTRSEFFSYRFVSHRPEVISCDGVIVPCPIDPMTGTLPRPPYPVEVTFIGVAALSGGEAVILLPRFIIAGSSPLTVWVEVMLGDVFLLSGLIAENPACAADKTADCRRLSRAEVVFSELNDAEDFEVALLAARMQQSI